MSYSSSAVPTKCANLVCGKGVRHEFANGEPMYYFEGSGPYCEVCYQKIIAMQNAAERSASEEGDHLPGVGNMPPPAV